MSQTVIDWSQSYATWVAGDGAALSNFTITSATTSPQPWAWANLIASYIAADYDLTHRGTARTVKGRSSNSTGVIADIAGSGTAAAPQVLSDNGTSVAFRSLSTLRTTVDTYEDTDWSALATNVFTDGTETINSINHTVVQSSLAGASWGMVNGSGFVWAPGTSARTWTLSSLTTAPYFYRALSTVPNVDYSRPFVIDVHLTGQVYENGNDAVRVGLWEPAASPYAASTARARIIDRGNFGGTSTIRTFDGTSAATSPETFAPDCIRLVIYPDGQCANYYGTWSGGWPAQWLPANRLNTVAGILNSFSPSARITFVFINAADASVTTTATIANVRYSKG